MDPVAQSDSSNRNELLPCVAGTIDAGADRRHHRRPLLGARQACPVFLHFLRVLTVGSLICCGFFASWSHASTDTAPKVTARPLGSVVDTTLTVLDEKAALERSQNVIGQQLDDFVLLDRQGRQVSLSQFKGKPLLVSFIYTACFQVCPTTTRNLQKAVEGTVVTLGPERFNIISIGFNQPFDSPDAMKSFSRQYGIHLPNWEFLSPPTAMVAKLTGNFGFSYVATVAGFDHINQVTIIDSDGKIVRQVYGETFTAEALVEPLKTLVAGAPIPPQVNTIEELVERFRILCSVYDPVTGKYRTNYAVYFEIAGALTFLAWLAWYFWQDRRHRKAKSG
ncbi:MAG: SCO family protein [Rhodocyclaceae bacterium]|nr:SCO family protein [Rhodocyclaceae bacterium]MBK6553819.1 SCO family protein [Rhodocyclaceae bacterium]MBK9310904.1 SCO family protein [Rhodocyclaceae bacterium]